MKAAVTDRDYLFRLEDLAAPTCPPGGALIDVLGCGLCGSDMDKLFDRPSPPGTVLGHEVVGRIAFLSPDAAAAHPELPVGQRVAVAHHAPCGTCHYCQHGSPSMCRVFKTTNLTPGGFSERIAVTAAHLANTVFPLPDTVSDAVGSCVEPVACCLRAVDRLPTANGAGSNALVIGLGFIGLVTAQLLEQRGFDVVGTDLQQARLTLATTHGLTAEVGLPETATEIVHAKTNGRGADVVFLSVVNASTVKFALANVRDGGTLMLFAAGGGHVQIDPDTLYFRELTVLTSYSPSPVQLREAHRQIVAEELVLAPLMSDTVTFDELGNAARAYREGRAMKVFATP